MLQQINLYREVQAKKLLLPAKQIILLNIVFIIFLSVVSINMVVNYYISLDKLKKLEAMQARLNKGLISAQETVLTKAQKEELKQQLVLLQQQNDYKKKMYKTFLELNYKHSFGWSKYLTDMARTRIQDTWITNFKFSNGNEFIHFEGISLKYGSVLQYLRDLGKTSTFQRKRFNNLHIFFDDSTNEIKFSIDS